MNSERHIELTGGLLMNLQGLELIIRSVLHHAEGKPPGMPSPDQSEVDETFLTNYAPLGQIIQMFNAQLSAAEAPFRIDASIVALRDALAHGRYLTYSDFPLTLWKFGRARNGKVPIEAMTVMSEEYLMSANKRVTDEVSKVMRCAIGRGYAGFVEGHRT